ncbi:MAG: YkgJ family cysteine cluster protein [Chloroflexi bacterium]|nr:YkgJ family cysteine cluster protein [Chloroflexota bacterium]
MPADLITDLDMIRRLAAAQHDRFEVMRYLLEDEDALTDAQIDRLVDHIAAPIIAAIDCTQCANCCRVLDVYLTPDDAARLAAGLDLPVAAVTDRYIDHAAAAQVGEWGRFRARPCALLNGTLCSVYAHRPQTCRAYPAFTPDFRWTLADLIDGAGLCPIIYNVLIALVAATDRLPLLPDDLCAVIADAPDDSGAC